MSQKHLKSLTENINQIQSGYISRVLSNNCKGVKTRIDVPLYQRPYTWKKDKVNVLFEDLISHLKSEAENAYYLGQLVFIKQTDRTHILDGQQRLTTLYIFINALANCMEKLKRDIKDHSGFNNEKIEDWHDEINEEIDLLYKHIINNYGEKDENNMPLETENKFKPYYEDDRTHFDYLFKKKSIIDFDAIRDINKIHKRHKIILAANTLYENINNHIESEVKDTGDNDLYYKKTFLELKCIKNILTGDFIEVSYTVLEPGIEFTIFETLNDRGEDLNCYDLTRNLMLNIAGKNHIGKRRKTLEVFDTTIKGNCSPRKNFDETVGKNLILATWNMSNEGKTSAGKYMKEFIKFVKDEKYPGTNDNIEGNFERNKPFASKRFDNYLNKLKDCSYAYSELLNPETKIKELNIGTVHNRDRLWKKIYLYKKTKAKQHYPMYLALRFKKADIQTIINYHNLIEKIYVNFILLSKKSPSLIESEMSKMALDIYTSDNLEDQFSAHIEHIKKFAKENKVILEDFIEDFTSLTANNSVSTFLLLNIVLDQGLPIDITSPLTLEHVMPETANFENSTDEWYDEKFLIANEVETPLNEEVHQEYLGRIGNHTILRNADNINLSNKPYEDKIETYRSHGTDEITMGNTPLAVSSFSKWNAKSINERQRALAVEAKKIWGF